VDEAGEQFLAGASLALDEHGGVRGRRARRRLDEIVHHPVVGEDVVLAHLAGEGAAQGLVLLGQLRGLQLHPQPVHAVTRQRVDQEGGRLLGVVVADQQRGDGHVPVLELPRHHRQGVGLDGGRGGGGQGGDLVGLGGRFADDEGAGRPQVAGAALQPDATDGVPALHLMPEPVENEARSDGGIEHLQDDADAGGPGVHAVPVCTFRTGHFDQDSQRKSLIRR
jgi:hypothetical protein